MAGNIHGTGEICRCSGLCACGDVARCWTAGADDGAGDHKLGHSFHAAADIAGSMVFPVLN